MKHRTFVVALVACAISVALVAQDAAADRNRGAMRGMAGIRQLAMPRHGGGGRQFSGGFGQGGLLRQLATQSAGSHSSIGRRHGGGLGQGGLLQQLATQSAGSHSSMGGRHGGGLGRGGFLQQLATQGPLFQQNGFGPSRHFGNGGHGSNRGGPGMGMGYGNAPLMNALQGVLMNGPGMYPGGCSQGFGPGYGQYGPGYGQYYGHRNDYADAYRDVGIANAVVDLFGNLAVMSMQNSPRYAVPVSAYPAAPVVAYPPAPAAMYAPPPAVAIPTTPGGHYETQQVVITPGRYEDIKVLVPESIDPSTGVRTGGYYEMRHRWIPEVTEYRPVWVTP